jgi:cell division protein FtsB
MARHAGRLGARGVARRLSRAESAWRRLGRQARGVTTRWSQWYVPRTTLYTRTVVWATAAICAALIVATLSEAWVNYRLQQQVRQAQAANAQIQQDSTATAGRIAQAESPATIEDEARARGYVRPGEQAVVIAGSQPTPSAGSSSQGSTSGAAHHGASLGGHWLDWWQLFFGG